MNVEVEDFTIMFPAPAGMSPADLRYEIAQQNVPRTRGDEPHGKVYCEE